MADFEGSLGSLGPPLLTAITRNSASTNIGIVDSHTARSPYSSFAVTGTLAVVVSPETVSAGSQRPYFER